jgi:hypothetical protein
MAYNNGFPMNYPQYTQQYPQQYQQPIPTPQVIPQQQMQQQPQNVGGLIWVQGEAGAKSYLVAPNTTVQLWDSEANCVYLKSADATGMPSMKILDYTIREGEKPQNAPLKNELNNYATKDDMVALKAELMRKIDDIKGDLGA